MEAAGARHDQCPFPRRDVTALAHSTQHFGTDAGRERSRCARVETFYVSLDRIGRDVLFSSHGYRDTTANCRDQQLADACFSRTMRNNKLR